MAFLGMRGTGSWTTDERPKSFREGIMYLFPNGNTPLTAIMSKMGSEPVDDPEFAWWELPLPRRGGTFTAGEIYDSSSLGTPDTAVASGDIVYVKTTVAISQEFVPGSSVQLRDASDPTNTVNCKCISTSQNSTSSYVKLKLLENDDNSGYGNDVEELDTILRIGSIHSEADDLPDATADEPTKRTNYTQIFRNSFKLSRTTRQTRLRTAKDPMARMRKETLEAHSIDMEWGALLGIPTEGTGSNGLPERTSAGLDYWIKTYASANVVHYDLDPNFSGQTWLQGGEEFVDTNFEILSRFGGQTRLALCGSTAQYGLMRIAKAGGMLTLTPKSTTYGLDVASWITPGLTLHIVRHPLLSAEPTTRDMAYILDVGNMKTRMVQDTILLPDQSDDIKGDLERYGHIDGTQKEFLTELGYEFHHPSTFGIWTGIGVDSNV